jgi:signal transduction histidine kinase
MIASPRRAASAGHGPLQPLGRLRLRLTAWYAATFFVILALLGAGLFATIRHQFAVQLDASLREATTELARAARIREMEATSAQGRVVDAVEELRIPDRSLFLLDTAGNPVTPASADAWIRLAAREASADDAVDASHHAASDRLLRLHAERFALASGVPLIAVAVADNIELEDRYAALIAAFGGAALVAIVLVAAGGWILVRESTAPVERTIEHMRRFMADAAHELRTPISVLRARAEVALQQEREPEAYVAALRGIEAESERLGRIVEDLLTLARADAGERPIERSRVCLDDLALDAAGAAAAMASGKGIHLEVDDFAETVVEGDPALLRQLAMILLDNAVKFTDRGGTVRVRVGAPGGRPTLAVEDSGAGIPAEQLPHVFERFYRGDPARTRTGAEPSGGNGRLEKGAGLGLSIARWIAEAHGATIAMDSTVGEGTSATVRFPAATVVGMSSS